MGSSSWSDRDYHDRSATRAATGASAFAYDAKVKSSGALVVHPDMDIKGKRRESRDSKEHPNSKAIAVVFDVTGSMGGIPVVLQKKLGQLMRILLAKSYIADPQILFGAVGDANCDSVPFQIGQFESGLEMDDDLGKLVLEGGGGGQIKESYELIPYYFANCVDMDCFLKRGEKGYLFTLGDEYAYPRVSRDQIKDLMGIDIEADVPFEDAIKAVLEKFEWFHIIPNTSTGQMKEVRDFWKKHLGERCLFLDNADAVCETIAMTVGLLEGAIADTASGADDLHAAGADKGAVRSATTALAVINSTRGGTLAKAASSNLPAAASSAGDDGRL